MKIMFRGNKVIRLPKRHRFFQIVRKIFYTHFWMILSVSFVFQFILRAICHIKPKTSTQYLCWKRIFSSQIHIFSENKEVTNFKTSYNFFKLYEKHFKQTFVWSWVSSLHYKRFEDQLENKITKPKMTKIMQFLDFHFFKKRWWVEMQFVQPKLYLNVLLGI